MEVRLQIGDDVILVQLSPGEHGRQRCSIGDRARDAREVEVELVRAGPEVTLIVDGRPLRALCVRDGQGVIVAIGGAVHRFTLATAGAASHRRVVGSGLVIAPMPGKVLDVRVQVGERVRVGDPVAVVEAMKMEHTLRAEVEGVVTAVHAAPGAMVDAAQILLEVSPESPA
jgi:acetyl/propionyl-CoA carboxylase alpha subunit